MKLRQTWRVLRIVHIALLASLGVYALMLVMMSRRPGAQAPSTMDPTLFTAMLAAVAGFTLLVITPVLRKILMPPRSRAGDGRALDLDAAVTTDTARAVSRLRRVSIITWVLCESIAIYGFLLSMLFVDLSYYAAFGGAAAAAMLLYTPRQAVLAEVVHASRR